MTDATQLIARLTRPGNLVFEPNQQEANILQEPLTRLNAREVDGATLWFDGAEPTPAGIRIKQYPTGHTVFYNSLGLRMLMTDPEGHPLHEAEWALDPETGTHRLKHVRMQLDCGQWSGIKPRAKTFSTHINIKGQPGWENMTLDDLRRGAAQAWQVPFSEIKYFYHDKNFVSTGEGEYDVQLQKDGLYILIDGNFEKTLFISFMFCLNWEELDLIPVVELFQSTLPGTGGAAFEFIWGLFEDHSRGKPLPPLRYRGLPTYPSKEAFNIFSAFFTPKGPEGEAIYEVFRDCDRSHEIEWTPKPNPPWRYFSEEHGLCLTVQDGFLFKVTAQNDPVAVPFINTARGGFGSCQRYLEVKDGQMHLHDPEGDRSLPLNPLWNVTDQTPAVPPPAAPFGWRHFFPDGVPEVDSVKMQFTVPLYPEGAEEIPESSLQPMVMDQVFHYMENHPGMPEKLEKAQRVLIHTFDTVISGCIDCTHDREYVVLYGDAEFAVKNAQQLWNFSAGRKQLDGVRRVKFLSEMDHVEEVYQGQYDMIYKWIPFMYHQERETCEQILGSLSGALRPGGMLFLMGPHPLRGLFDHYQLDCRNSDAIVDMPYFRQHLKMCPENVLNPSHSVFFAEKRS